MGYQNRKTNNMNTLQSNTRHTTNGIGCVFVTDKPEDIILQLKELGFIREKDEVYWNMGNVDFFKVTINNNEFIVLINDEDKVSGLFKR